jgi:aspartate 1-decarboxylase
MHTFRKLLRCKIHRATVTHADLEYEGSITIPPHLLAAASLAEFEAVCVWNVTNGNRFETYTILGEEGSDTISVNGAAAHLVTPGDTIIIAAFGFYPQEEVAHHRPTVVFVDERNRFREQRAEVAGPHRPTNPTTPRPTVEAA